jgi:7-cyano-7-deazaguanine synthase
MSISNVCVLLSGGIDSATCIAFYQQIGASVSGLYIGHGQPAAISEAAAAREVARHFAIPLATCQWLGNRRQETGLIKGRNAFLYVAGLLESDSTTRVIASGIHAGTTYPDCSPYFLQDIQRVYDQYAGGDVVAAAPFVEWSKPDIWRLARTAGVPLDITWSCEQGFARACQECLSCRDREALINAAA